MGAWRWCVGDRSKTSRGFQVKDVLKYGLLAIGGYWLYSKYMSAPAAAPAAGTPATATPPASTGFSLADLVNALKGVSPATPVPPAPQVCPSSYTGTYPNCVAPVVTPPALKVGNYAYTDKASYQTALVNAAVDAAGGGPDLKQTADAWNWDMVNKVGVNFSPDPTSAMAPGQRYTPITAAVYYDALRFQNLLDYPSGLSGLRGVVPIRIPHMVLTLPGGQRMLVRGGH